MTEAETKKVVFDALKHVAPEADLNELSPDENLREVLDIDSFDFLNFLIALNEGLGVEIPESDYDQLTTLDDILRYISFRLS